MFLKFDSFRLECSLSRWQRVGLISEEHRDINQENYINIILTLGVSSLNDRVMYRVTRHVFPLLTFPRRTTLRYVFSCISSNYCKIYV